MSGHRIFKVIFHNHGKVYELFARRASASDLYGFVEIGDLVFDDDGSVVIDPTEERMRQEFQSVKALHLPMHAVIRIEEVEKRGACLIRDRESGEKVTPFPLAPGKKPG